jgi:hypothetical protein
MRFRIRDNAIELRPQFSYAAGRRRIFKQYQFQSRSLHFILSEQRPVQTLLEMTKQHH